MAAPAPLRVVCVLGSTRTAGPPHPANVGRRVGRFIEAQLRQRGHAVDVVDPIEASLPLLERPHFAYGSGRAPPMMEDLATKFKAADAYVMQTPEYNHAPSPALLNTLNHFGASIFAFKPSAIVSYSAGQWGGARAAVGLRPVLSELGCLPVSAMVHVPRAGEVFDEQGAVADPAGAAGWEQYAARTFAQLEFWALAARAQRAQADPARASPAFATSPQQRNAPGGGGG